MTVSVREGVEERNHGSRIVGIVEEAEVGDELVLCANLQIIAGFGLPVVHSILFHAHEGGVIISLAVGIALA